MSKMGVYGFLRLLWPLFPGPLHAAAVPLLWLALGGVVLGAFAAMRQTRPEADDRLLVGQPRQLLPARPLRRLRGHGPLRAHERGRCGRAQRHAPADVQPRPLGRRAVLLHRRPGGPRRGPARARRLRRRAQSAAPVFAGLCGIAMFSSLGLPGLNGFVGEFLIFRGVWGLCPGRRPPPASGSSRPPSSCSPSGSGCSTGRAPARPRASSPTLAASISPCSPRWSPSCSPSASCRSS